MYFLKKGIRFAYIEWAYSFCCERSTTRGLSTPSGHGLRLHRPPPFNVHVARTDRPETIIGFAGFVVCLGEGVCHRSMTMIWGDLC